MADFGATHTPTARKAHQCEECGRTIDPGETYERHAGVWEGDFFTFVSCAHCRALRAMIGRLDADFWEGAFGGVGVWIWEGLHREYLTGNLSKDLAIRRAARDFARKWRTRSGDLLSIPAFPTTEGATQ